MAFYKKSVATISSLGLLIAACLAAPDSSADHSRNNHGLSSESGSQRRENIEGRGEEGGAGKSNRDLSNDFGGRSFCPLLSSACMAACPDTNTQDAITCLTICKGIRSDCCNCKPLWTIDEDAEPEKSAVRSIMSRSNGVVLLSSRQLREWAPQSPSEMCAEEAIQCVEKCKSNEFQGKLLPDCITLCKGYLDSCCTCGVVTAPTPAP